MTREACASVDRPAPGHYQVRLSAILSSLPAWLPPPPAPASRTAERRWTATGSARRSGQLALPLQPP
ncbi:MAG TPA: hypothetical protein VH498_05380 [Candidatus Dormibacteraeota bacterium]|nr:hypothetical protein [Candidatus Dormibacteraeota bacterium]